MSAALLGTLGLGHVRAQTVMPKSSTASSPQQGQGSGNTQVETKASQVAADVSAEDARGQAPAQSEVIVRGRRPLLVRSPRVPTGASTVLTSEQLSRPGESSADVLARVPGVHVRRTGGAGETATASIRGTAASQTPVYLAGIRLNDEITGGADLSTVPLWMLSRMEVYRGNAPSGASRLGLSGAVFMEPKRASDTRLGGALQAGSFGERGAWVAGQVASERASTLVALRRSHTDNDYWFLDDQGQRFELDEQERRRHNADVSESDGWVVGQYRFGRARVVGVFNAFDREQGVTGVATTPARQARRRFRRLLSGVSIAHSCGADCEISSRTSAIVENAAVTDPARELRTLRSDYLHAHGKRFGQSFSLDWQATDDVAGGANVELATAELTIAPRGGQPRYADRNSLSAAGEVNAWALPWLQTHGLLALRCEATHGEFLQLSQLRSTSRDYCTASRPDARLGALVELTPSLALLTNLARYSRPPTLGELYGTSVVVDGNPELRDERSINYDLGVRASLGGESWQVDLDSFAFMRWADDLIRYRRTSLNAFSPYNVGSAKFRGVEAALASTLFDHVSLRSALTLVDGRETTARGTANPTANDILPLLPRLVANQVAEIYDRFPSLGLSRVALGATHFYRSNRYVDPAGLVTLPANQIWGAHASAEFKQPEMRLSVSGNNLLDARVLDIIGLPLPSRSFHASLEAWW